MADLTAKKCRGINLQARDCSKARWYPDPTAPAAWVEVWAVDTDKPVTFEHATLIGRYAPGQQDIAIDYNPATDRYKELRAVTYSAAGVPNVRYLDDAPAVTVLFSRLGDPAVIAQTSYDPLNISISITGFSEFTTAMHLQEATDSGFTSLITDFVFTGAAATSTSWWFSRSSSPGQPSETRYVRVRHSSTGASGPWTDWSNELAIFFYEEPL